MLNRFWGKLSENFIFKPSTLAVDTPTDLFEAASIKLWHIHAIRMPWHIHAVSLDTDFVMKDGVPVSLKSFWVILWDV